MVHSPENCHRQSSWHKSRKRGVEEMFCINQASLKKLCVTGSLGIKCMSLVVGQTYSADGNVFLCRGHLQDES